MKLPRLLLAGAVAGATLVGSAWAGVGLVPVTTPRPPADPISAAGDPADGPGAAQKATATPVPAGQFLVGADVASIAPDPERWQTEGCPQLDQGQQGFVEHLATPLAEQGRVGWPVAPDCVYLGGYGIGPARAATSWDQENGVNVRTLAVSNGTDTVVWQMVDLVGFFSHYRPELCDGCGIRGIREAISAETGIPVENVAVGSTHTHGGADGYGAWGGLPSWYREQLRDVIVQSALDAVAAQQPATIEVGSVDARGFNNERRDHYFSTPDYGAVWLQARALPQKKKDAGAVLATLVNYAAHPTVLGAQPMMHGDWPATAAKALGDQLGGVGLVIEGGLGNVSPRGGSSGDAMVRVVEMGQAFAAEIGRDIARGGTPLESNAITAVSAEVVHPVTNAALAGLGVAGLLDRDFLPGEAAGGPGAYEFRKSLNGARPCASSSPLTIKTEISGFRIGELTVLTAPGEIFSAVSLVLKSKSAGTAQTMVFGQTQDSLGYIIQSFEVDPIGGYGEYVPGAELAEYEETFMLDRCFGDHVVQVALQVAEQLRG